MNDYSSLRSTSKVGIFRVNSGLFEFQEQAPELQSLEDFTRSQIRASSISSLRSTMNFLVGFLLIGMGILIIKYRYHIYGFTGDWEWAIKYLGGNGTIVAIVFIGMMLIGAGAAYPFGVIDLGGKNMGTPTVIQQN